MWQRFVVADRSMEPALQDGDRLLGRRSRRPFTRGEIVIILHPRRADFWLVKRAVGLPGETVTIVEGQVLIDGRVGRDRWAQGPTLPDGAWTVGEGEVFLLSDNRSATRDDGRSFGPVSWARAYRPVRHRWGLDGFAS